MAWNPYTSFNTPKEKLNDTERLEQFAETGDSSLLTPELAKKIGGTLNEEGEFVSNIKDEDVEREALAYRGVDIDALRVNNNPIQTVESLLPLAIRNIADRKDVDEGMFPKDAARVEMSRFIFENPKAMVEALFNKLDPNSLETLELTRYLEEELEITKQHFESVPARSPQNDPTYWKAREVLQAFLSEAEKRNKKLEKDSSGLYFVLTAIREFSERIIGRGEYSSDPDSLVPFEITNGVYAAFSMDKNRIYVASASDSEGIENSFKYGWGPEYKERGYDAATYKLEYFDEDLLDAHDSIIDSGTLLTDLFPEEFKDNPALLKDYVTLMHSRFRSIIEEDLGFRLRDLSVREQLFFLQYAKQTSQLGIESLKTFTHMYGSDGLRTFLVTANDEQLRERVFEFAKNVPEEKAKEVFAAYGKLVGVIDDLSTYLQQTFGAKNRESTNALTQKILERAKKLLASAHEYKDEPERLLTLINSMQVDQVLFFEGFRELRKQGEIKDFSSITGLEFGAVELSAESFSEADKNEMLKIAMQNYEAKSELFRNAIADGMKKAFDNPKSKFYILRLNGKIVGFNRFDQMEPDAQGRPRKYFGSFNVDPAFGNGKLGDVMIEQTVLHEAKNAIIEAHCLPDSPITKRYLADGFTVIGEEKEMYPEPVLHIMLDRLSQAQTRV